ncbi:MAG: hypothetical protein EOR97_28180 [Mesorhizobium sp.]|uniref:hypothetical protein n=1 Tax=Mesorhizobium sp. TaxID=1871066 RepID=UPI000FE7523C|nr:hypothetical protein [Mesorhizobium sp.]RWN26524.1 MAG: hypothetical protein EOR97_28180 [Mesorhizobium sp.]
MSVTVFPGSKKQRADAAVNLLADLTTAFALARMNLGAMTKEEFLLTRGQIASFDTSAMDIDAWRGLLALIEIIGGEMTNHLERKV